MSISIGIARVVLGLQRKLIVNNLDAQCYLETTSANNKGSFVKRDFIQMAFATLGIEVEFSGKRFRERGVIIDKDEHLLQVFEIEPDSIKFGETVVKVESDELSFVAPKINLQPPNPYHGYEYEESFKTMMVSALAQVRTKISDNPV